MRVEKRILLFLQRREIYLLEKLLHALKEGLPPEPILEEMEEEKRRRKERQRGREVARKASLRGLAVLFTMLVLLGIFSRRKALNFELRPGSAAREGGTGQGPIIISYYYDADYLELIGFNWRNYLEDYREIQKLKRIALYIFLGGKDLRLVERKIKEVLSSSENPLVRGRLFLALSRLHHLRGDRKGALFYARRSLELAAGVPALAYDPLTMVLKTLWETGRVREMKDYIPRAMELLNRDFYYPLFKFASFYILQVSREENYRSRWALFTLKAILHNFPSNLKLANDFTSSLKPCRTPLCSLAMGMVYSSIRFKEGSQRYLREFLRAARANPSRYGALIPLAMEYLNAY